MRSRHAAVTISLFAGLLAWTTPPLQNPPSDTRAVFLVRHADLPHEAFDRMYAVVMQDDVFVRAIEMRD
ncbi:MAG: hypothetical protein JKY96_02360 [Phycisphaerales bacterium]|nr:hypothetical protein [Phycisphaerales bacterium]